MASRSRRAAATPRPQQQSTPQLSSHGSDSLSQSLQSGSADGGSQVQLTVADIDDQTQHLMLEDVYEEADVSNTGAFQMEGPRLLWVPEAGRPYATDSSRVDEYIAKEEKRRKKAANKGDQLRRNGLASGADDALKPILAIQDGVPPKVEARRRAAAQKAINQYSYESCEDEANPEKRKYSRLERLKQTLARHEQPYGDVQKEDAAAPAKSSRGKGKQKAVEITEDAGQHSDDEKRDASAPAMTTRGNRKRKATESPEDAKEQEPKRSRLDPSHIDLTEMGSTLLESDSSNIDTPQEHQGLVARPAPETEQPSPEDDLILMEDDDLPDFRTLKNNPEHPDFGLSFKAALEQAFAKEKKDQIYENSEVFFDARMDEDEDEELAREEAAAYPQGRPRVRRPRTMRPRATAASRPQTSIQAQVQLPPVPPLRITRVYVAPKYSVMEYCMARILGTTCGFEDGWVVRLFIQHMRGDDLALPVRSKDSLLIVSATKPEEYFGTDPKDLEVATEVLEYFGM